MPTFVLRDLHGEHVWGIERDGPTLTMRHAAAGDEVETITRRMPDEEGAKRAESNLVRWLKDEGYKRAKARVLPAPSPRRVMEDALVENPDDLAMHRAYADYLVEHGDPRGEFIQVQLMLEDLPHRSERRQPLVRRAGELILEHGRAWLGELAPLLLDQEDDVRAPFQFGRGWLEELTVSRLTAEYAEALARAPQIQLLQRLSVERVGMHLANPAVRGRQLSPLELLLRSLYLGNVCKLEVSQCDSLRGELPRLLDPFALPRLTHLRLRGGGEGDGFCEALASSGAVGRLRTLELRDCGVTDGGARALARSPDLKRLDLLSLDYNHLSAAGLQLLRTTGVNFSAAVHRTPYHDDDLYDDDWE